MLSCRTPGSGPWRSPPIGSRQRLLASPLAVAQFFARSVGGASPGSATLALGVLGRGSQSAGVPARSCQVRNSVQLRRDASVINSAAGAPMGFMTPDAEGLGGVRQRADRGARRARRDLDASCGSRRRRSAQRSGDRQLVPPRRRDP